MADLPGNMASCYGDILLQCWLGIGRKYQFPSWLQFSHSWHSQYPLSFQQFNSRKLLLNVFIKGSIVSIRLPIYLHQSYARQCRSLYAHLWRHKQIILAVSTNFHHHCRMFTRNTPNTSCCSNTSTGVTRCWKFPLDEILLRPASRSIFIYLTLVDDASTSLTCDATV